MLDIVIFNRDVRATEVYSLLDLTKIFISKDEFILVWENDPLKTGQLPFLIILDEANKLDFFAAINATPNSVKPFSAFSRVLTPAELHLLLENAKSPDLNGIEEGILSLIFCEAMIHGAGNLKLDELTPSACRRTFSYSLGKAIATGYDNQTLSVICGNWLEALRFSDFSDGMLGSEGLVNDFRNIGFLANNLNNNKVNNILEEFCTLLLNGHKDLLEKCWSYLTHDIKDISTIREFSEATREVRVDYFNYVVRNIIESKKMPEHSNFIIAFLATQISPGTLNHLNLLLPSASKDPSILLWYGFLAGLQSSSALRKYKEGLGERLLRDILKFERVDEAPNSDISLSDLKVLSKVEHYSQQIKTGYLNLIQVEIYPLITSLFRVGSRPSRQQESKTNISYRKTFIPPETFANLSNAMKLLEKASQDISKYIDYENESFKLTSLNETKTRKSRKARSF